jgi:hypothetical protein
MGLAVGTKRFHKLSIKSFALVFEDYNETALATLAIVPDDGPMRPKHVVLV